MIKGIGFKHKTFTFPCGEMQVQLVEYRVNSMVSIQFEFEKTEDVFELLLVCDAIKRERLILEGIIMKYIPFSRQDRVCNRGESFSLKVFADLINSCKAKEVTVFDPHFDVATALIDNCKVYDQTFVFGKYNMEDSYLISPDAGALKKIYNLAKKTKPIKIIECTKERNITTGEILKTVIHHHQSLNSVDCYIVDDICDGGRTFIEIAKVLKQKDVGKITLMVTHGFFTKGLEVFDGLIDEIYTKDGRVK